jgi:hypothetical protein
LRSRILYRKVPSPKSPICLLYHSTYRTIDCFDVSEKQWLLTLKLSVVIPINITNNPCKFHRILMLYYMSIFTTFWPHHNGKACLLDLSTVLSWLNGQFTYYSIENLTLNKTVSMAWLKISKWLWNIQYTPHRHPTQESLYRNHHHSTRLKLLDFNENLCIIFSDFR